MPSYRLLRAATAIAALAVAFPAISRSAEEAARPAGAAAHVPAAWKDVDGHAFDAAEIAHNRATVFIFVSTQCPVSGLYMPRVAELANGYKERAVRFFLVDPNRDDTAGVLRAYARARSLTLPLVQDTSLALADWLAASCTPEAVVVDPTGDVAYRGRIDDNLDRAKVVHADLREALDAVLAGKAAPRPRTLSFGCAIFRDTVKAVAATAVGRMTFTRDIAPLLNKSCVVCHRAGESAPFALQTYRQARTWASALKEYTSRRIMPPWKAAPGVGDFHDARMLSDDEIARIAQWADSGAPEGDPKELPAPPTFPDPDAWSLGKPDMVVQPSRAFHLAAEGPDVYRNFVLPVDFDQDRYVSAMEFKPGNRAVVHHIVLYVDVDAASVRLDGKDAEPGYTVPGTGPGVLNAEWGEVWVPGRTPRLLPPGVAVKIPKGAKLLMQVHYHKNGVAQTDTSQVALYFAKGRVEKLMRTLPLVNPVIALQPGNSNQRLKMTFTLPVDAHLYTIFPHMHLLGREMRVTAILPDGEKKSLPLIVVKDWDFNWQETYAYKSPVALPHGTRIEMVAVYDNSDSNPRQANHPAKVVRWGEQTTDEMCVCVMGFTVDREHLDLQVGARGGI
jgi:mono/diheme cytochrome c family protein